VIAECRIPCCTLGGRLAAREDQAHLLASCPSSREAHQWPDPSPEMLPLAGREQEGGTCALVHGRTSKAGFGCWLFGGANEPAGVRGEGANFASTGQTSLFLPCKIHGGRSCRVGKQSQLMQARRADTRQPGLVAAQNDGATPETAQARCKVLYSAAYGALCTNQLLNSRGRSS
jgi:hypothetical protein